MHAAVDAVFDDAERAARCSTGLVGRDRRRRLEQRARGQAARADRCPGVPDVYQGTELWEDSLVDPDNRRPVDFDDRATLLGAIGRGARSPTLDDAGDGQAARARRRCTLRRDRPELFTTYAAAGRRRRGRRPRARLRPRRRGHRRHPAAGRAGRPRRLGRHRARRCPRARWRDALDRAPVQPGRVRAGRPARRPTRGAAGERGELDADVQRGPRSTSGRRCPQRVRLSASTARPCAMTRGDDGWWRADVEPVPRRRGRLRLPARRRPTRRCPTRARGGSPTACTSARAPSTATAFAWTDQAWTGRQLAGRGDLRAARRHVHARGHPRRRDRAARPPASTSASTSSS